LKGGINLKERNFLYTAWNKVKNIGLGFAKDIIHIIIALAIFLLIAFLFF